MNKLNNRNKQKKRRENRSRYGQFLLLLCLGVFFVYGIEIYICISI
ncbi:hypothetical protein AKUH4B101A_09500 [Apilactobacillus kunkeei]|nr:hypothetical protein AKUH4B101A_09500 [Apilactobacillus kunkeei]